MKMLIKFTCFFLVFFAINCLFRAEFQPRKHLLQFHNASILATNFPTPGYPSCSNCGGYHPGKSCPKDEPPKDKTTSEKKKKNETC